ncbi:MAG: EAL domain-containing protein [Halieaceae bacterium]|nr:EAL domain-containing protein [Halieaceae bacterium]
MTGELTRQAGVPDLSLPAGEGRSAQPAVLERSNARLLMVDDDAATLKSSQRLLASEGFQCNTVRGGAEGIEALRSEAVDVLLLDLRMPDVDGFAVLDQLQSMGLDLETIVLSGHASFGNANQVFHKGACDFLPKPHSPAQLFGAIDRAIHKLNLRRKLTYVRNQLEQSEQRYHFIAANSPDLIYLLDNDGRFVYVNERAMKLLGYMPEELIGKHFSFILDHPRESSAYYAFRERRTGERSSRNVELNLKWNQRDEVLNSSGSDHVPIELNAMGMYQRVGGETLFLGTYGVGRDISERRQAEETIRYLAYHDRLTRLPNRDLFLDRLKLSIAQTERNGSKLAVMFLDMDGFKYVNDTLGHVVGDRLLQLVANRLQGVLRDSDTVSRIGGDEFNVLLSNINGKEEAGLVARKIINAFAEPISVDKQQISVAFSIGISIFPDDASGSTDLIKNSDMAMYHIKANGKRGYEFFSESMQAIYEHRLRLEDEMRLALEHGQFECYFQPQYGMPGRSFFGMEALIRWNHPERGMVPPDLFIPVAEEIGLISEIGAYMLDRSCAHCRSWLDQGYDPAKVSINVSASQLLEHDFDEQVQSIVDRYKLPSGCIALEITESMLMQEMDTVIGLLGRMSRRGIDISIDDFGVGYSSLAYLQRLPINILKIDRSFLSAVDDASAKAGMLKGMVALAHGLDLKVIMEGVETSTHLDYVTDARCDIVQGYYLARPMPASEVQKQLRRVA